MRKTTSVWPTAALLLLLSACAQLRDQAKWSRVQPPTAVDVRQLLWTPTEKSAPADAAAIQDPAPEPGVVDGQADDSQAPPLVRRRGRPYAETRSRLLFFREQIELEQLDIDFDIAPDAKLRDTERDRAGFRAEFGNPTAGGFFQIFVEDFRAAALLLEEFDNFGIGGGVLGAPVVGEAGRFDFVVPFRFEVDLVGGSESVAGFDQDLFYIESMFELGFGARAFGLQPSTGLIVHSFAGLFDSDNPATFANTDPAEITGTNVGAYIELLYKHQRVPLMARARAIIGDVSGVLFSFGFAF